MTESEAEQRANLFHYLEMSKRSYRMMLYELVKIRARQYIEHELPDIETNTRKH